MRPTPEAHTITPAGRRTSGTLDLRAWSAEHVDIGNHGRRSNGATDPEPFTVNGVALSIRVTLARGDTLTRLRDSYGSDAYPDATDRAYPPINGWHVVSWPSPDRVEWTGKRTGGWEAPAAARKVAARAAHEAGAAWAAEHAAELLDAEVEYRDDIYRQAIARRDQAKHDLDVAEKHLTAAATAVYNAAIEARTAEAFAEREAAGLPAPSTVGIQERQARARQDRETDASGGSVIHGATDRDY